MNVQSPFGMSNEAFKELIEQYIERGTQETDDLDADLFFDELADPHQSQGMLYDWSH